MRTIHLDNDNEVNEFIIENLKEKNKELQVRYERLLEIARKMHLYIFLHSDNEQEIYDELGLTEEENIVLGYSGQIILKGSENENISNFNEHRN